MSYERKVIDVAEIRRQEDICRAIAEKNAREGVTPLAMVDTYGCQQNEADSEKLRGYLAEMGCGFTEDEFAADIIVVNTCAVREHAEMRVLGNVGALNHSKKARPGQIIAVCGCMVQQEHMAQKIKMSYPVVDLVFGGRGGHPRQPHGRRKGVAFHHVRLQQLLHVLHRALRERAGALPPGGGRRGGGARSYRGGL